MGEAKEVFNLWENNSPGWVKVRRGIPEMVTREDSGLASALWVFYFIPITTARSSLLGLWSLYAP